MEPQRTITYADAGVDIEKANRTKELLKELVRRSYTPRVLTELGSFGGLFEADFGDLEDPVLVASTDGVGTKLKVAVAAGRHTTVGMDLVNHCVNDILVMGAVPLFFMDYIALGRHDTQIVLDVVEGLSNACTAAGCALLGGETAEMPDMYKPGEYDLAGTIVGVVGKREVITGDRVRRGDALIGLMSDGLHTNGYSLARKLIFDIAGWNTDTFVPEWGKTVADALLAPHRCYLHALLPLLAHGMIHGMAHITGGGITDNVPRILPAGLSARVQTAAWNTPPIFRTLVRFGNLTVEEAFRAFNMGIGMVLVVDSASTGTVLEELTATGETAWLIGEVVSGDRNVQYV
ncbi:MAG TPA: phosphoribosylformylglycinamidine cyclo-ligase [Candidatus Latescibacteria bacterium]|nr:phosphoribosylformylglycinamidine cyclo-ligase [Candidatus Latescibacterota bacterium]